VKSARFYVRRADGVAFPTGAPETDSEARAKMYADHWARVTRTTCEVRDRGEGVTLMWEGVEGYIVYTARAPSEHGIPLPRPQNPPSTEETRVFQESNIWGLIP